VKALTRNEKDQAICTILKYIEGIFPEKKYSILLRERFIYVNKNIKNECKVTKSNENILFPLCPFGLSHSEFLLFRHLFIFFNELPGEYHSFSSLLMKNIYLIFKLFLYFKGSPFNKNFRIINEKIFGIDYLWEVGVSNGSTEDNPFVP
jgi:hypothetical protein